ncbi:2-phospho-L-lactate transferase [Iodidimonas sp. SYSU 1G8]|uniref:2-phospho-L-lactate transferase n=1 Tax=Iodidimonas sp. SYSU 1G8 TaxID=3133967 RepID=UPI0031FEF662
MSGHVLALCGGVGGAKLALGLSLILPPERLTVVINTGDDFTHLGLRICPDIDTVTYTLGGLSNTELGWGRSGESWEFMENLRTLGGPDWFNLGDKDLATHVERTRRLMAGEPLSAITADFAAKHGIGPALVPMTDDEVATIIETDDGDLAFQHYFVRDRCQPEVRGIRFEGAEDAMPSPGLIAALKGPLDAIVICPSNPFLSVDPLLALPGIREALAGHEAPVIAVSPIVGGKAIKGPTAKLMGELGLDVTAASIVHHYRGLLDGFVLDSEDSDLAGRLSVSTYVTNTVMKTIEDRTGLARAVLDFAIRLKGRA